MTTTAKPKKKQKPGLNAHLGHNQEEAIRFLLNGRKHPKIVPPPATAKSFSFRPGKQRELALTQLSRNKGLDYEIIEETKVYKPEAGWWILIHAALAQYLDREVPGWDDVKAARAGGSKKGWSKLVGTAIDEYLDIELPGWRSDLVTDQ